jgi:hypothetical protein
MFHDMFHDMFHVEHLPNNPVAAVWATSWAPRASRPECRGDVLFGGM